MGARGGMGKHVLMQWEFSMYLQEEGGGVPIQ